ncbi:MAG: DUF423 domain-containing protein [Deltaproteobacteria bacterium]|nr:DUF423 domain-containing protein [Deltaproteobacteria bacterium]
MGKWMIVLGAVSGFVSVAAGAFGAHALKARLAPDLLVIFETGARYQMYHALALVLIGVFSLVRPSPLLDGAGYAMLAGTLLFSGSLYVLALTDTRWLGAVTPFGGVAFLVGWGLCAVAALKIGP